VAQAFRMRGPLSTSTPGPDELITCDSPPVNEVALSVQLDGPPINEFTMLARYWSTVREDFPNHQKQPPLPPISEDFHRPPSVGLQLGLVAAPPAPRYWFISADETSLLQV
jgi:hypothetical protein